MAKRIKLEACGLYLHEPGNPDNLLGRLNLNPAVMHYLKPGQLFYFCEKGKKILITGVPVVNEATQEKCATGYIMEDYRK